MLMETAGKRNDEKTNMTKPIIEPFLNNKSPLPRENRQGAVIFYRKGLVAVVVHCVNHLHNSLLLLWREITPTVKNLFEIDSFLSTHYV